MTEKLTYEELEKKIQELELAESKHQQAEDALQQSENHFRTLINEMPFGFALHEIIVDNAGKPYDYKFLEVNSAFEKLTGLKSEDIVGKKVLDLLPQTEPYWIDIYGKVALTLKSNQVEQYSEEFGKHFEVFVYSPIKGQFATVFTDITDRKLADEALQKSHDELEKKIAERAVNLEEANEQLKNEIEDRMLLEDQLIRSERLAATGQLAASIAHEINSPLQGITSLLNSIEKSYKNDEDLLEDVGLIKEGYNRIKDTVKKLLDLNRPGKERMQPINVNYVIENTVALLGGYLKKNKIKINLYLSSKVPDTKASPQQLGQVFLNLVNNAVDAMVGVSRAKDGWKKREAIREITINSNLRKDKIIIKVSDTGPGISEKDLKHIFDPFYTTKRKMGMGIGLSICHGIVENHGGSITARNLPDEGTAFTIAIPVF